MLKRKVCFLLWTRVNHVISRFYGIRTRTAIDVSSQGGVRMRSEVRGTRVVHMGKLVWVEFRRLAEAPIAAEAEYWVCENDLTETASSPHLPQRPPNKGLH